MNATQEARDGMKSVSGFLYILQVAVSKITTSSETAQVILHPCPFTVWLQPCAPSE
jgi:hypothetical protein